MCYAIVEINYKAASTSAETIKLPDEAALAERLKLLQNNDQVERIRIFLQHRTLTRTTVWDES